jgi:hypothetical protein
MPLPATGSYETRPVSNYGPPPFGAPPTGFSGPMHQPSPPSAPGYAGQSAPGTIVKAPPANKRPGLIALVSAIALVVLLGGTLLTLGLTKSGPFAPPASANRQTTPTSASIPAGFKLFTNGNDHFSIIYPSGWDTQPTVTVTGSGEQFNGPASQTVQIIHGDSAQASDLGSSVDAFCLTFSFSTNGHLYLLSYASPTSAFNSNRSQYFTPMEQSFKFLT